MVTSRTLRWIILSVLILSSFFLASFNATLKYIVDQRRELVHYNAVEKIKKQEEKMAWEEATLKATDALEKKRRNEAGEAPSASSSSSSSSDSSDANSDKIEEKYDDIHAQKVKRESHEAEKRREREDPTIGKFRTTQRPLDGFAEEYYDETSLGGNNHGGDGDHGYGSESSGSAKFRDRPPVQSHSRQHARAHLSAPHPAGKSSTFTVADSHYAKAIRMLSSEFDSTNSGGNALPHPVSGGEYDQDIGGKNGRGDGFVKMDQKVRRRKRAAKKKKRRKASSTTSSKKEHDGAGKKGGNPFRMTSDSKWELPEDEPILNVILDVAYEWFVDTMDWLCETLGIELEYDETLGSESYNSGSRNGDGGYEMSDEDDLFSWRDTRVGSQLIWIYGKVTGMWSRQKQVERQGATISAGSKSSSSSSSQGETSLAERDQIAREGLFHLEKAAQLGHSEAQRMVANSLASGILPLSDHSLMHRVAEHQYSSSKNNKNWTSILSQSILEVPDDFSSGGQQLSRAILLWHLSAMDGNVESAMALGYRHLYSASGGSTQSSDLANAAVAGAGNGAGLNPGYHPVHGGPMTTHGTTPVSHYGVLGTCPTALAYYEAAAHGVMDELEAGPTKGKVNPPIEEHRLAEIYTHGGASVALDSHNKPDELEEALQYYRMLASRNRSPEPDLVAAFTIANFYFHGYRGVKQDLRLALKYYEICGDYSQWEGGGQAGLMHVWGIGMSPEERDLGVAYAYFKQGTPGGIEGCSERWRRRKRQNQNKDGVTEEVTMCDRHCVNGMGLLHLLGVEGLVDRNVNMARRWFEHGKDFGDPESIYNYAMLRLGWMVAELEDLPTKVTDQSTATNSHEPRKAKTAFDQNYMALRADAPISGSMDEVRFNADASNYRGPSHSDHNVALQELARAASKGHLQAKHKLGMLYASGAAIPKKHGQTSKVIAQNCASALRYFKAVAEAGHTVSRRNRAAWKQYGAGDYESALRNYLAAAETGNEIGQVNAAFLLEQGYCLGMTTSACTHASVRLWRAAARQGNLEACLRVGDFYYYGRMKMKNASGAPKPMSKEGSGGSGGETATVYDREKYLASLESKAFYFIPGPYRWTRYILYPEELFDLTRKWLSRSVQNLHKYVSAKLSDAPSSGNHEPESETSSSSDDATCDEGQGTCSDEWTRYSEDEDDTNKEDDEHMAIAAQYYRKAAEEHKSSRANFNLGFMHEWGLGLTQDFPLAKRHYDLAGEDNSNMAASIALWAMNFHQKLVRFGMTLKDHGEG